jgi:hypothetical protein
VTYLEENKKLIKPQEIYRSGIELLGVPQFLPAWETP